MPKKNNIRKPKKRNEKRETAQLFDLTLKCILKEASHPAVVHLINSIHKKSYPLQTTSVKFEPTEHIKKILKSGKLQKIVSDIVVTLSGQGFKDTYLIEAQIKDDAGMVLRIFNYSVQIAVAGKTISDDGSCMEIDMPAPTLLYFEESKTKDIVSIKMKFPDGESVLYNVPTLKILEHSVSELEGMALLLPFFVLKIRKELKKRNTDSKKRKRLSKELDGYVADIVRSLKESKKNNYINEEDLALLLNKLYHMSSELYGKYEEFVEVDMNLKKWAKSGVREAIDKAVGRAVNKARKESRAEGQAELLALWESGVSLAEAKKIFSFS
ncbi:MAG: hypothetical protein FWC26_00905 [Fibromonadales bacterium]|nr:hypothetical protein [Fibromonadales bacterium]